MISSSGLFWQRTHRSVSLALLLYIGGCGYSEYEMRLNESKKYYSYLDKVEQSLAPKWVVPGNLMELRVPRQFNLIPPPPPAAPEDENAEKPIDPRQPDYVNLLFPGLFGAWEATFKVVKTDSSAEERRGYIYALSNYWEFAGEHAVDAGEFVTTLKDLLAEKLKIPMSDPRPEVYPTLSGSYHAQIPYDVCSFKGKEIDGVNYTFEVFARTQGSVIGVIVTVLPEAMESPQKVSERIPLMLETFNFTKTPPKAGAEPNAPVQPAAGGAAF